MPLQDHIDTNEGYSNRVADAIYLYTEQETQFKISNPLGSRHDLQAIELKLQYYSGIYNAFRKKPSPDEKLSLRFVLHEMAKMRARLNPTTFNRVLYSNVSNLIRNFVNGNNLLYARHNNTIKKIERELVQEHNLQSLTASMKKTGFNFEIEGTLKKMIAQDLPQFHIRYIDIHYPKADFVLHFKKIPTTDLYYFEKFDALSRPTLDAILNNDPSCRRHTFSLQDKIYFTAGEAANLVNGKCICKNMDRKETWLMLDATSQNKQQPFKSISFNLEKALERLPIKLNSSQYQALLRTLKAGNPKEIAFTINDLSVKYTIDAAPLRKTIDVLDRNDQLVDINRLLNGQSNKLTHQLVEKISKHEDMNIDLGESPSRSIKIR